MNELEFITELKKIGIELDNNKLNSLKIYKEMLQEYNQKFNLTAIIKDEDIYLKHFYDSLTLLKCLDLTKPLKLLDIGTGAGFPGLVLKIVFPNLEITLLDANSKKITFLKEVSQKLNLQNIYFLNNRAENLSPNYREHFDIITSRAVSQIRILLELSIPYLKVNGLFLPLKSNYEEELKNATNTLKVLNSTVEKILEFNLPFNSNKRSILVIKKNLSTPDIYPRSYDKILKKSL